MDEPGNRALLPAGGTTEKTEHDARQRQQQQLRDALAVELEERVQALNRLLLELERPWDATAVPALGGDGPAAELYDALFREAHSLKGAARMVGLGGMEQLAHAFESALTAARQQGSRPTDAWFKAAYQTADTFHELQFATQEGEEMPPDGLAAVLVALAGAAEAAGADPAAPAPRRAEAAATTLAPDRSPAGHPIAGQPPAHRLAPHAPPVGECARRGHGWQYRRVRTVTQQATSPRPGPVVLSQ